MKDVVILDGAMGTMLQNLGMERGYIPEILNMVDPDMVREVHRAYVDAGAEIIYTNTFGANRLKMKNTDYDVGQVVETAVRLAKEEAGDQAQVALDIGPIGYMLEPMGTLSFEDAVDIFKELILAGSEADLIIIETMTDLYEVKAAVLAAQENSDLPILVSMSFEDNERTFAGVGLESFANLVNDLGVDAIGLNCSLGPIELKRMIKKLALITDIDLLIKPNAGLPNPTGGYDMTVDEFIDAMKDIYKLGVRYMGGCCGSDETFIQALVEEFKGKPVTEYKREALIGPSSATVYKDQSLTIIGEKINPTGRKSIQKALMEEDMAVLIRDAIQQAEAGADVLDVNVGHPGVDEKDLMAKAVKAIQSVVDLPLQIDSVKGEAIEAGLRAYNGKAIVNSVSGEQAKMDEILPLVKKYNAMCIGLCLDEDGIPDTAQGRVEVGLKIVAEAEKYGIRRENIILDPLALTVSSNPESALESLKAIDAFEEMGLNTTMGVSNISFGMPNRELINASFLSLAMDRGLNFPIVDPTNGPIMDSVYSFKVLTNHEGAIGDFIGRYQNVEQAEKVVEQVDKTDIQSLIVSGQKDELRKQVQMLLETVDEMEVIEEELIPALDYVGEEYSSGRIFLPQLIRAAETAQEGFAVIRELIESRGEESVKRGEIIIATVKGDIHDIGKNIGKVMMENYGYDVVDMGRDVEIQAIVDEAKKRNIRLVGLSALMTTTLDSMKETIIELKDLDPTIKIMVGGAVLTEDYAYEIGADYYLKDAKMNIEVARDVFGGKNA